MFEFKFEELDLQKIADDYIAAVQAYTAAGGKLREGEWYDPKIDKLD